MNHYVNLGTLAIRWTAVGFFVLALLSLVVAGGMGSMMGGGQAQMSDHIGEMMQGGGAWMWWGPTVLNLIIGLLLYAVSRPLGRVMGSGLE